MRRSRSLMLLRTMFAVAVVGGAGFCLAQAVGDEVWVKPATLNIREGKGAAFNTVATAKQGDKVKVIAREDKWLKVQFGDKQGYVFEASISPKKIGAGGIGDALAGGASGSGLSAAAASKGLTPEATAYATQKKYDPNILETMITRNENLGPDWVAFAKEGNVGPERKK